MPNKLLSIIIPVYNVEQYLKKCVNSVIEALKERINEIEILLIDDGSKDNSASICDELASTYNFIKVIHKENGGVSSARNLGIDNSIGEYVTFIDSDDYVNDNFIQIFDELYEKNIDFFSYGFEKDGKYENIFEQKVLCPQVFDDFLYIIKNEVSVSCCVKIVKRDWIVKNNLYFNSTIKSEDFEWFVRCLTIAKQIKLLPLVYYVYYNREDSVTHTNTLKGFKDQLYNLNQVYNYINNLQFLKKEKNRLLRYTMHSLYYCVYFVLINNSISEIQKLLKTNKNLFIKPYSLKDKVIYYMLKIFGLKFGLRFLKCVSKGVRTSR